MGEFVMFMPRVLPPICTPTATRSGAVVFTKPVIATPEVLEAITEMVSTVGADNGTGITGTPFNRNIQYFVLPPSRDTVEHESTILTPKLPLVADVPAVIRGLALVGLADSEVVAGGEKQILSVLSQKMACFCGRLLSMKEAVTHFKNR
jgi:hypothetical protein